MHKTENKGPQFKHGGSAPKKTNRPKASDTQKRWLGLGKYGRPNATEEPGQ